MNFRDILVPVDLTDRNREAIELARQLAKPGDGTVRLLHVIEVIPGLPEEEERKFYDRLDERARKHLVELGERLEKEGVRFAVEIGYGSRAGEILKRASEIPCDLIVLSSHRVSSLSVEKPGEGWGTLSYQIAILSPCKVLLVK